MCPKDQKVTFALLAIPIVFAFIFCDVGMTMEPFPKIIEVRLVDTQNHAEVCVGDELVLEIDATQGTGYAWEIIEFDATILEPIGETYFRPEAVTDDKPLGATAFQIIRFKAIANGQDILVLHYKRPWEKEKEPLKMRYLNVHVKKND